MLGFDFSFEYENFPLQYYLLYSYLKSYSSLLISCLEFEIPIANITPHLLRNSVTGSLGILDHSEWPMSFDSNNSVDSISFAEWLVNYLKTC